MPTPSFCRVIYGNLGCQKIRVLASHASLNHLLYCAEYDLKTGGTTGPLPPPPLFIRYLQRLAQSESRQSAHLLPPIFDFGFTCGSAHARREKSVGEL